MIIGNNNNSYSSNNNVFKKNFHNNTPNMNIEQNFEKRFNMIKNENKNNMLRQNHNNISLNSTAHSNINSKKEMTDKSFNMLQERYNQGLISLDEFTKKCNQLNKMNQK